MFLLLPPKTLIAWLVDFIHRKLEPQMVCQILTQHAVCRVIGLGICVSVAESLGIE